MLFFPTEWEQYITSFFNIILFVLKDDQRTSLQGFRAICQKFMESSPKNFKTLF